MENIINNISVKNLIGDTGLLLFREWKRLGLVALVVSAATVFCGWLLLPSRSFRSMQVTEIVVFYVFSLPVQHVPEVLTAVAMSRMQPGARKGCAALRQAIFVSCIWLAMVLAVDLPGIIILLKFPELILIVLPPLAFVSATAGNYVASIFCNIVPIVMNEGVSPMKAIACAWRRTLGSRIPVFFCYGAILMIATSLFTMVMAGFITLFLAMDQAISSGKLIYTFVAILLPFVSALAVLHAVFTISLYRHTAPARFAPIPPVVRATVS